MLNFFLQAMGYRSHFYQSRLTDDVGPNFQSKIQDWWLWKFYNSLFWHESSLRFFRIVLKMLLKARSIFPNRSDWFLRFNPNVYLKSYGQASIKRQLKRNSNTNPMECKNILNRIESNNIWNKKLLKSSLIIGEWKVNRWMIKDTWNDEQIKFYDLSCGIPFAIKEFFIFHFVLRVKRAREFVVYLQWEVGWNFIKKLRSFSANISLVCNLFVILFFIFTISMSTFL